MTPLSRINLLVDSVSTSDITSSVTGGCGGCCGGWGLYAHEGGMGGYLQGLGYRLLGFGAGVVLDGGDHDTHCR